MRRDDAESADLLEELAMKGEPMPEGCSTAEQLLFLKFRYLYASAALGVIDAEQGRREKFYILGAYEKDMAALRQWLHTAQLWKRIEDAGTRYAKERTTEHADAFFEAVYGMRPKGAKQSWEI